MLIGGQVVLYVQILLQQLRWWFLRVCI